MAFPQFTVADLAEFSGRAELSYAPRAERSIRQAMLLFLSLTHIEDWPTDSTASDLATEGVLAMADHLYLIQPYATVAASPMSSETIGSYSYSKSSQAGVQMSYPTGVSWFDLAVSQLSAVGTVFSSSITVMEDDDWITTDSDGQRFLIGPLERDLGVYDGFDP